jgi:hypothetical protein
MPESATANLNAKNKLFLLAFFLCSCCVSLSGQTWCPAGAQWHYSYSDGFGSGYVDVKYIGDTLIGTQNSKIISRQLNYYSGSCGCVFVYDYGHAYTYEDSGKVYLYSKNQFYILYDFADSAGTSWVVPGTRDYGANCDSVGSVVIDSVGTTQINGETLKYICVTAQQGSAWGWTAKIIEKIGPVSSFDFSWNSYLFPQKHDYCGMMIDESSEGGSFRCYSDSVGFSYDKLGSTPSCDFITDVPAKNSYPEIFSVFPNPSNGIFQISNHSGAKAIYNLISANGKPVASGFIAENNLIAIQTKDFLNGVYILRIINSSETKTIKIIVDNPE